MSKKIALIVAFIALLIFGTIFYVSNLKTQRIETVRMSEDGFEPKSVTIQRGTKVIFRNEDNSSRWPASDVHPTHKRYPGSALGKCGTPDEKKIFDACGRNPREDYSFVFNEVGQWTYHDHLKPSLDGEIIVLENSQTP